MELDVTDRTDGISQVALVGRLDVSGLHAVDISFHGQTAARKQPAIVDLSRLEYIASLGMGMLIACADSLRRHGHLMVLAGARSDVEAALRQAGLDQALTMAADVDEAQSIIAKA
jgi:anti-anti-sigma factor